MTEPAKFPYDSDKSSVDTAREWLVVSMHTANGATCPCCERLVKVYRRKLYASMAFALVFFAKVTKHRKDSFVYVPGIFDELGVVARGGDFVKLVLWELIEGNGVPGWYRITQKGRDFVDCRIMVPCAVDVLDGELVGTDDKMVTIVDALGKHHNYDELMK